MGDHSAVAFGLAHPAQVEKLVLMGGGTGGPSQFMPMPTEGIKLLQNLYREPTIDNLASAFYGAPWRPGQIPAQLAADLLRRGGRTGDAPALLHIEPNSVFGGTIDGFHFSLH